MRKSFLQSMLEMVGFGLAGLLFFVWFLGRNGDGPDVLEQSLNTLQSSISTDTYVEKNDSDRERVIVASDSYSNNGYEEPTYLTSNLDVAPATSSAKRNSSSSRKSNASLKSAVSVRTWKGVHRDEDYAWICFQRFRSDVLSLSKEYGLYPEVFMARVIAYSYDYLNNPKYDPTDNNFPALKRPNGKDRAMFRSPKESLKAYAVINAGEVKEYSREGALGKHDRGWTLQKIIENYAFVNDLSKAVLKGAKYKGLVGPANKVSKEETRRREYRGEKIKMVSSVENKIKKDRAKENGFDSWEDYLENLPEELREKQRENAEAVTDAISKKKALNLSRRVKAKRGTKE